MKNKLVFPVISDFMQAYLHEDYDLWYQDDNAALTEFAEVKRVGDVRQMIEELDSLLGGPPMGLLSRYQKGVRGWNYIIGETDDEARAWLLKARNIMADILEHRDVS